jgi:hypothetical protein
MLRQLLRAPEDQLHLIAPDDPGFGNSDSCCAEGLLTLLLCGWM